MNKAAKAASPVVGAEQEKTDEANFPRLTRAVYGAGGPGVCVPGPPRITYRSLFVR
jgi:hypothetical protein